MAAEADFHRSTFALFEDVLVGIIQGSWDVAND
jgi:hypothetical protein